MNTVGRRFALVILALVRGLAPGQSLDIEGETPVPVSLSAPACATLPFAGTAKQTVRLAATQAAATARRWSVSVHNPDGSLLASLSLDEAGSMLDRVRLLQDGIYQVTACPGGTGTAEMTLQVSRAVVGTFEIRLNMADDPISDGIDVASTHYRVRRLRSGQSGVIHSVSVEARTPPAGSDTEFAIRISQDGGVTWNDIGLVVLPAGQRRVDVDTWALATATLHQNDLIRYDVTRVGSVHPGGGVALTLSVGIVE